MPGPNFNIIYFVPDSDDSIQVAIELDAGFKMRAGLKPDINHARVSYVELDKLGDSVAVQGSLQFWFSADPTADDGNDPDLTIESVSIVDMKPEEIRIVAGDTTPSVAVWRIYLTDFRDGYVSPRGGRLRWGVVNPSEPNVVTEADGGSPPAPSSGTGTGDSTGSGTGSATSPLPNATLVNMCLTAMGLNITLQSDVTSAMNAIDPPLDLQWHGSHAPTELQKLLDRTGCVACPDTDGTLWIYVLGGSPAPDFTDDTIAYDISAPGIDRRGSTVVYTSAPSAIILTETISGMPPWEFVVQDIDDSWQPLSLPPAILQGNNPVTLIQTNFQALFGSLSWVYVYRLQQQLYRCIRLNTSTYPPAQFPVLHSRFELAIGTGTQGVPPQFYPAAPQIVANMVVQSAPGFPAFNLEGNIVDVSVVIRGNILMVDTPLPLGKISGDSADPLDGFVALESSDLAVRFSHEQLDSNNQPLYFEAGYTRDANGNVTTIDAVTALAAPTRDMVIIHKPEWQQYLVNPATGGGPPTGNFGELTTLAQADAAIRLAQAAVPQRLVKLVGFSDQPPTGQIAEVTWSQREVCTDLRIQTWYMPSTLQLDPHRHDGVHSHPAYPAHERMQGTRSALGMSGSTHAAATIRPQINPAAPPILILGQVISAAAGGGKYNGRSILPGVVDVSATTNLATTDFGPYFDSNDLLILNAPEIGQATHDLTDVNNPGQTFFIGKLICTNSNGIKVVVIDGFWWENCS